MAFHLPNYLPRHKVLGVLSRQEALGQGRVGQDANVQVFAQRQHAAGFGLPVARVTAGGTTAEFKAGEQVHK